MSPAGPPEDSVVPVWILGRADPTEPAVAPPRGGAGLLEWAARAAAGGQQVDGAACPMYQPVLDPLTDNPELGVVFLAGFARVAWQWRRAEAKADKKKVS